MRRERERGGKRTSGPEVSLYDGLDFALELLHVALKRVMSVS